MFCQMDDGPAPHPDVLIGFNNYVKCIEEIVANARLT